MIQIDQEKLCDFCEGHCEYINRSRCEGSKCDEARQAYLDDLGITSEESPKCFKNLCIGDPVYFLENREGIPVIYLGTVKSIQATRNGNLKIIATYKIKDMETQLDFIVTKHDADVHSIVPDETICHLHHAECKKELERMCITRIVKLSKIIGSV